MEEASEVKEFELMLDNSNNSLEVMVVTSKPGFSLRLQTSTEDVLLDFRLNPNRHSYLLDTSALNQGVYWLILRKGDQEVKRSIIQIPQCL